MGIRWPAAHLSVGANPPSGIVRRFTWSDVETFRQIKAWRDAGLSVDVINFKLVERNTEAISNAPIGVYAIASQNIPDALDSTPASIAVVEKPSTRYSVVLRLWNRL